MVSNATPSLAHMARPPRPDIPGVPQHVVQRGNDRRPCFFTDSDYLAYRSDLCDIARREGCAIHAYVLMTNHAHLLVTPHLPGAIGRMVQSLGRRYVRYVNDRHHRTGTLWEGRYKACLVESGAHLLRCHRYIELNPVRAGMVADPGEYFWSSHAANAFGRQDPLLSPHFDYLSLCAEPTERQRLYRAWVMEAVAAGEVDAIRRQLHSQHVYGSERFRQAVESRLGRPVGPRTPGRPRKPESESGLRRS